MASVFPHPFGQGGTPEGLAQYQETLGQRLSQAFRNRVSRGDAPMAKRFTPQTPAAGGVIFYVHGGGFLSGDGAYAHGVAAMLAHRLGRTVYCAPYRLAPQWPYPAAVEDVCAAYWACAAQHPPQSVVLCGDSAGGALLLSLLLCLKAASLPMPAGLIALSPWADLTCTQLSDDDPMLPPALLRDWAGQYAATAALSDPLLSPLLGDLRGLPPTLLLAGGAEALRTDAIRLHAQLRAAGVDVQLTLAPGQGHCYPISGGQASREAFALMGDFIRNILDGGARDVRA